MNNNTVILSDDELINLIQMGDSRAQFIFYNRYEVFANKVAKKYYHYQNSGVILQDFQAVCFAMVYVAVNKYIVGNNTFYAYWETIAKNACMDFLNDNSYYGKARSFSGACSLDEDNEDDADNSQRLGAPDDEIYENIASNELTHLIKNKEVGLTDKERVLLTLYLADIDMAECAKILHIGKTYAYDVYKSAIKKMREYINKRVFIKN